MATNPPNDPAGGAAGDPPLRPPTDWSDPSVATRLGPFLEQEVVKVRHEAAGYRVGIKGAAAEARKVIGEAAGLKFTPEEPPAVEALVATYGSLAKERDAAREQVRGLTRDMALERVYRRLNLDSEMMNVHLTMNGGLKRIDSLDPASESYADDLEYTVSEAAQNRPALRVPEAPRRTSAPMVPGPPSRQLNREDLASMSADEIERARRAGLTDEILGRRGGK